MALLACAPGDEATAVNAVRPNILMIVADDMGVNDLGLQFEGQAITPTLDRLAETSLRFTRHYADSTCTPSRVALLTGRNPSELGFSPVNIGISPEMPTYPRLLQAAGYGTHHIGKWHAGSKHPLSLPMRQGFDTFYGFIDQFQLAQPDHLYQGGGRLPRYENPWLQTGDHRPVQTTGHLTDLLTTHASDLIRRLGKTETPWLINLWFLAPHTPIQPAAAFARRFPDTEEGRYFALLAQLDNNLDRVLQALEQSGQRQNTLVLFLSDNGGTEAAHPSNHPYQGSKATPREGALRVPFFLHWPRKVPADTRDDITVNQDIFRTIIAAAGLAGPPAAWGTDLLSTARTPDRLLFWEMDNWLTRMDFSVLSADGRWRLSNAELFDLAADPSARHNVAQEHPAVSRQLLADFLHWRHTARRPELAYTALSPAGHARLEGDSFQRAPGYQGFTLQLAFRANSDFSRHQQVILQQEPLWQIRLEHGQLHVTVPGMALSAAVTADGSCQELVLSTLYMRQAFAPEQEFAGADLYLNGHHMQRQTSLNPPLPEEGWDKPTWIGLAGPESPRFEGWISRPVMINEYLFADDSYGPGRSIATLDPLCP